VINRIELLGFDKITKHQRIALNTFVNSASIF